jgi:phage-related protein
MTDKHKIPLVFYRTLTGREPVREWYKAQTKEDRNTLGADLQRVQWRFPVGMPLCRPMGARLYEVRTTLSNNRIARVLIALYRGQLVALHAFIKKTAATPDADLQLARKRLKEIEHEKEE